MMSRHFLLRSELSEAIAKRHSYAKNQLSVPCSFFNHFVTYIHVYVMVQSVNRPRFCHILSQTFGSAKIYP